MENTAGVSPIRVVLVEGSAVLRAALRQYLVRHGRGIALVGEAGDADEAVRQALHNRPDVVILDLDMPQRRGWESARRIHEAAPGARILLISLGPTGLLAEKMREHGVFLALEKAKLAGALVEMIRECARGACDCSGV